MVSLISLMPASISLGEPSYLVTRANILVLPFVDAMPAGKPTPGGYQAGTRRPSDDAELVQRAMKIRRVAVDPKRAGRRELVPPIPAREQADAQHSRAARGEEVPHGIADDIAVSNVHAK